MWNSSEDACLAKLGLGIQEHVAGYHSVLMRLLHCWKCCATVMWPPATGCRWRKAASWSERRCWAGLCAWATETFLNTLNVTPTVSAWEHVLYCPFMALNNVSFYCPKVITRIYWHLDVIFGLDKGWGEKYTYRCVWRDVLWICDICILQRDKNILL